MCTKAKPKMKKPRSLPELFHWFLGFTAVGGLSHAGGTQYKAGLVFWMLLTVLGGVLTAWNVYKVVKDYLSDDVS